RNRNRFVVILAVEQIGDTDLIKWAIGVRKPRRNWDQRIESVELVELGFPSGARGELKARLVPMLVNEVFNDGCIPNHRGVHLGHLPGQAKGLPSVRGANYA